jgi:hypothetical protein
MGREVLRLTSEEERAFWANELPMRAFRDRWTPVNSVHQGAGKKTAFFWCPDCGALGNLVGHDIAADGTVTPSVLLPDCGFHETGIRLVGWEP